MQVCGIDDDGAHRLPEITEDGSCDIKSKDMVRFIFQTCGWDRRLTYRVPGKYVPGERLVNFVLADALELHQGRLLEPDKE